ncbi:MULTISPECIES: ABC transporter ATP-binding protein [unclassified Chelatococcus]|uniref:ABC transporter ATP-binding protein n=1 Tax=unclassified Chelatococcus TaxID=2638111 RepID=UPI001BCFB193|nr:MULTISPECIES: ABC transporter ATP-binding protein [unclassified Chelatococcus]MBS7700601.1 ABC transporter ATP-binding protein [Chelatococcus sp. YT9]MBX3558716.1 ABC transporter ATP-binding protein [Chelatococcus sp.]
MADVLLDIDGLRVTFDAASGPIEAVRGARLSLRAGETVAIVGESGSGKSTLAKALIRQNQAPFTPVRTRITGRAILATPTGPLDLVTASAATMRRVRATGIAMIAQDALSGLNPVVTVGRQVGEALRAAGLRIGATEFRATIARLLDEVGLPDPAAIARRYPHQLSGGQRQRVMIAMAIARNPRLIIADEPTTALDVTVQARILRLIKAQQAKTNAAVIFITHDLGVVAHVADRVAVMYAGEIVEVATVRDFLVSPQHPYTAGLLASVPGARSPYPRLKGYAPEPKAVPAGCAFRPRCPFAGPDCIKAPPVVAGNQRDVRCWRAAA